jgi:hypothetical protein
VLARPSLDDAFGGIVATDRDLETGYGLGSWRCVAGYQAAMYCDRGMQLGVVPFRNVDGGKQDPDRLAVDILSLLASKKRAVIQADLTGE